MLRIYCSNDDGILINGVDIINISEVDLDKINSRELYAVQLSENDTVIIREKDSLIQIEFSTLCDEGYYKTVLVEDINPTCVMIMRSERPITNIAEMYKLKDLDEFKSINEYRYFIIYHTGKIKIINDNYIMNKYVDIIIDLLTSCDKSIINLISNIHDDQKLMREYQTRLKNETEELKNVIEEYLTKNDEDA